MTTTRLLVLLVPVLALWGAVAVLCLGGESAADDRWTVTAYCPCAKCCGKYADGITASGEPVTANGGRFVAGPRELPFGTMVRVPGYADGQPVPVLDRGGAIKGKRLDVFFPTHAEALKWGRRRVSVRIVERTQERTVP